MSFTIADESGYGLEQYRVTVEHPNGGVSEVIISLGEGGRLEVSVDASRTNDCEVDVDEMIAAQLEANR